MTRRLVVAYLVLTAVVLALLVVPLGVSMASRQEDQLLSDIQRDAFFLASFVEDSLERGETGDLGGVVDGYGERTGARVVVVDAAARLVADSDPLPGSDDAREFSRDEIEAALAGEVATGSRRSDTLDTDLVFAAVPVASGGVVHGAVRVSYPREEVDERVWRYWLALAGMAAVSLLAAGGLAVALGRSVSKPLRELERSASALGRGDLSVRAPASEGPPEVRRLAGAFNDMAERLEQLVDAQEAFVADASHQLRSPLTALRLRIENSIEESDVGSADLEAALAETTRLARLVDGLLALARADRASGRASAEEISVEELLAERAEVWQLVADEHGVELRSGPSEDRIVAGLDRVTQVLDNLVVNALDALADGGGSISLWAETDGASVVLHVTDDGPGLPPEVRQRAFDRFWREDPSDGSELGGTGLGLAICRKLVTADGGSIELADPVQDPLAGRPAEESVEGTAEETAGRGPGLDVVVTYPRAAGGGGAQP